MTARFLQTVFTPAVKAVQTAQDSRKYYARHDATPTTPDTLTERERTFIAARDSVYLATTTETGWPYVQHRGGPPGFLKVLDDRTLGFADYRGNRQYVSVGNATRDNRVALLCMNYPNRERLKLLGRMRVVAPESEPHLTDRLRDSAYRATVERFILIDVEAYDWNCSQHITPRFTIDDVNDAVNPLKARIAELEAQLAQRDSDHA